MPVNLSRRLVGTTRSQRANRQAGCVLAFVAGATNAGGFLAVHQYTSHMSGVVSAMADQLALGSYVLALAGAVALASFMAGAACCAILVNHARRRRLHATYAIPLLVEAGLLLGFGLLGARLTATRFWVVSGSVLLLCFTMGLQNAIITKLSDAEIRTTHITGLVTDIGIELGRLAYWNRAPAVVQPPVTADLPRLGVLATLASCFLLGGVVGALGFEHVGYAAAVFLAMALVALAIGPVIDDLSVAWHRSGATGSRPDA